MSSNQASPGRRTRSPKRSRGDGARRAEILTAAIERFGRNGYENTRWADIADDVGIGPTALYHYFDSKQHCLFVILDEALRDMHARFDMITAKRPEPRAALRALCNDCFELSERDVLRNRVLVAGQASLSGQAGSEREEQARRAGRDQTRALELAWAEFLERAMERGAIRPRDPRMLARALLGLYNSVWYWYRADQTLGLPVIADFFVARMLALADLAPDTTATAPPA